jgi:hypothetical protein
MGGVLVSHVGDTIDQQRRPIPAGYHPEYEDVAI